MPIMLTMHERKDALRRRVAKRAKVNWRKQWEAEIMPDGHLRIHRPGFSTTIASWDILQSIKNDMLGEDVTCVEIFPAEVDVVNEQNYRHFWPIPEYLLPGWQAEPGHISGFLRRHPEWESGNG